MHGLGVGAPLILGERVGVRKVGQGHVGSGVESACVLGHAGAAPEWAYADSLVLVLPARLRATSSTRASRSWRSHLPRNGAKGEVRLDSLEIVGPNADRVKTDEQKLAPEELRGVIDALHEGLQVIDRSWRYVFVNRAAAAHGRTTVEPLLGRTMMDCYPGIDKTEMFGKLRRCMELRESQRLENEFTFPDGSKGHFELRVEPCSVGIVVLSVDVTNERRVEQQLRHAQKMEAVGRLAGSVAHDFNNLLSVVLSHATLLQMDLKAVDPARANVDAIKAAGERAARLTKQLLAFSRRQVLSPSVLKLNDIVCDCERLLARLLGEDVQIVTRLDKALAPVFADPGQIDQVLVNLAVNARDAMPNGGTLTIETKNVVLDDSYKSVHFGTAVGPHVMLAISDTGVGMDRETQNRIFEPFFTTKEAGKGTGLGLSTVFGIVEQSKGTIWVYSEPGNGSTFKIYLPTTSQAEAEPETTEEPTSLEGTETILLVEDQEDVRTVAETALRRYGYHVLEASNAGEALLICERHPQKIHLLLTDVIMPRMGGQELAERLAQVRPDIKVLFMSGYTDHAVLHHGILDSGFAYMQKPFVPELLARRVREVLDKTVRGSTPPQ